MRVLFLVSGLGPKAGWGTEYIQDLIIELSQRGVKAIVVNPILKHTSKDWKIWSEALEKKYDVKFINLNYSDLYKKNLYLNLLILPFLVTPQVLKIIKEYQVDIIHEFSSTPVILLRSLLFKIFFKKKVVFTQSVYNNSLLGNLSWIKYLNFADKYVVQSKKTVTKLKKIGVKPSSIELIYPNIQTSSFKKRLSKEKARKLLSLPTKKFVVSYFGPLTKEKGVLDLIEASKRIKKSISQNILIALFIVWKGSDEHKKIKKYIEDSHISYLKVTEKFVDIPLLLNASDIAIFPQQTGMGTTIPPISIIECLAANTQVVSTNVNGADEWINSKVGRIIPSKNPDAIKRILENLYQNRHRLKTGQISLLEIAPEYVANKYLQVYKNLLG